jgi:hypothetical protein
MKSTDSRTLTQIQLVQKLHDLGCDDVTVRRLAIWREHDVLPPFSMIGGGRGRGEGGRQPSGWTEGDAVLNQALWIYRLLKTHPGFVDLYLPLWLLGFRIPLSRIREGLAKPLETISDDSAFEIEGRNAIEDFIDDAAYEFNEGVKRANWNLLDMPPEAIAAVMNILLNNTYDLEDEPFEHAMERVSEWERNFQQKCLEFLDDSKSVSRVEQLPSESGIFRHARFVNDFLSVPHLRQVVTECTDEDLMALGNDIAKAREIIGEIKRLLPVVLRYVPPEIQPKEPELIETIISVGKVSLWIDLSLRRSGHGNFIDHLLVLMLEGIRTQSIEDIEKEIAPYGSEISATLTMMMQLGEWLASGSTDEKAIAAR